jgi:hypothetical protein
MSNDVSIFNNRNAVGVRSEQRLTKLGQALASSSTSRRIQCNINGTFKKLVNGEQIGNSVRGTINVIIIAAQPKVSRVYYAGKYDPNAEATMPNCWSNGGDVPEAAATDKQHDNCAECPMNIKGSGENGGRACRFQRRISVLLEGDTTGDIYQMSIPSKSLFGKGSGNVHPFESYVKFLVANGESPDTVVTTVAFDDEVEGMELVFSPSRQVTDEEWSLIQKSQARPEAEMYTRITVAQVDGATKEPKPRAAAEPEPKPEPKPKVQRSDDPDDAVEEPKKRASKKPAEEAPSTPAPKADLAAAIAEWSDD